MQTHHPLARPLSFDAIEPRILSSFVAFVLLQFTTTAILNPASSTKPTPRLAAVE